VNIVTGLLQNSSPDPMPTDSIAASSTVPAASVPPSTTAVGRLPVNDYDNFEQVDANSVQLVSSGSTVASGSNVRKLTVPDALVPHRISNGTGLQTDQLLITAACVPDGVNVTVSLNDQVQTVTATRSQLLIIQRYSGAIYAAERYSFCRQRVENTSQFSLFLRRPTVNNACNTLETVCSQCVSESMCVSYSERSVVGRGDH
jgi:hypothetical protein